MRCAARWLLECLRHVLGVRSPSTGRVVPWPWDRRPQSIDFDGVIDVATDWNGERVTKWQRRV